METWMYLDQSANHFILELLLFQYIVCNQEFKKNRVLTWGTGCLGSNSHSSYLVAE